MATIQGRCVTSTPDGCGCGTHCTLTRNRIGLPNEIADGVFLKRDPEAPEVFPKTEITPFPVQDFQGLVDGAGYKGSMDDPNKIPLWLVPVSLIRAAGRALGYGANKYAANNWRRGMQYSEVYSALQRHLCAWNEGEDNDPESGLNHLDHAAACLGFLTDYVANREYAAFDNRFKRPLTAATPEGEE